MKKAAATLGLALATAAPSYVLAQGTNTIRGEARVVLVDAVVTDKKGLVPDLAAKDFEVFEDGKKQTVTSFSSPADPAADSKSRARYTILLFDDSGMDNAGRRSAREAAIRFVETNAGAGQMIAIVNVRDGLELAQNFTGDAARLKAVLGASERSATSLNRTPPVRTADLFSAVRSLAQNLASTPGRKTLIVLTADFELGTVDNSGAASAAIDACNRADVAVYGIDTRSIAASPTGSGGRVRVGPPMGVTIGGCTPDSPIIGCHAGFDDKPVEDGFGNQKTALLMLAAGSGGLVVNSTNDLAGGLGRIAREQSEFYVLGYTPPDTPEGSCHKLRVKVDRGGVAVRARAAYCNARSNNALAGSSIETELESLPAAPPGGSNALIEVPSFYASGGLARVDLAMEIPLRKVKTAKQDGKLRGTVHLLGIAHRPDGSVAARFSESVGLEFGDAKRLAVFLAAPFHYENQFEIVPGSYTLDVAWDAGDESRGKVETPLVVNPYQPAQFAVGGLVLSRDYGPASDLRLNTSALWTADRTPLIAGGLRIVPSGSNRFRKTDTPVVYAEIHEPLLPAPDPKAALGVGIGIRILSRKTGAQMLDTGVLRIQLPEAGASAAIPVVQRVPIGSLAPGSYRLELEAGDTAGHVARAYTNLEIEPLN